MRKGIDISGLEFLKGYGALLVLKLNVEINAKKGENHGFKRIGKGTKYQISGTVS